MKELGKFGIMVSPIGMGCLAYGGGAYWGGQSQGNVNDVVARALDLGFSQTYR